MQLNFPPWPHIFPADVITVQIHPSDCHHTHSLLMAELPDLERQAIISSVPKRQTEFAYGRRCLRQALHQLGYPNAVIPVGKQREPLLPKGALGSISHCENYVVAAASSTTEAWGLGVDVEKHQPLSEGIHKLVLTPSEHQQIDQLTTSIQRRLSWDTLLFSIKESFYKALFTCHPFYVDFLEVQVQILNDQQFSIQPLKSLLQLGQATHIGHYRWDEKYIYTGLLLEKPN